jgi:chromosome segregation ATPase
MSKMISDLRIQNQSLSQQLQAVTSQRDTFSQQLSSLREAGTEIEAKLETLDREMKESKVKLVVHEKTKELHQKEINRLKEHLVSGTECLLVVIETNC